MTIHLSLIALTVHGLGVHVSVPSWLLVAMVAGAAIAYRRQIVRTRAAMRRRQLSRVGA